MVIGAALLAAATTWWATEASAIETSSDLREACAAEDIATRNICYGFIQGAGQFYIELRRAEEIEAIACADPAPKMDEIRQAIVVWVDAHPEYASERAVDGLMRAAAATWPCD
jgi:hypothetical protein